MKDDARFYDIPGVGRYPSVTTILQVIAKPALYLWQAKQGSLKARNVMDRLKEMSPYLHDSLRAEFGQAFFLDGYAQAAEAADYGTQAHAIIEMVLKGNGEEAALKMKESPNQVKQAVGTFLTWRDKEKFELIKAESVVYSKKLGYAGTADAIGKTKDGVTLLDWKTAKAIYWEYSLQAVAYKYAAEEMTGESIPNVMICRFGKDGVFNSAKDIYTVPQTAHPGLFDTFIDAKRLWEKWRESQRLEAA